MPRPVQKQQCAGGYSDRFLHRLVRHCGLEFFDKLAGMQQSGGYCWSTPTYEIGVPNMPSLKAKKLGKLPREKVLLEL